MQDKIIVSKFGGSSVADAAAMSRSAQISLDRGATIVLVSATYGTTNAIISLVQEAITGPWKKCKKMLAEIIQRHEQIAAELNLNPEGRQTMDELFTEMETLSKGINLLKDCSPKAKDSILGLGERISSILFTQAMNNLLPQKKAVLFDVRRIMRTDDRFGSANPLLEEIRQLARTHLQVELDKNQVIVTQGYIGQTAEGANTTLGRGGSDFSAALVAEAISADILEIWTDVAGIATTDPRICPNARPISEISFSEASELATFGAKILHPATLAPALRANIPVYVGSSIEPEKEGTWVRNETNQAPLIRAMAQRRNQVLLTLSTPRMLQTYGFLAAIFKIFGEHKISVDAITTSEISVAMTLNDASSLTKELVKDLSEIGEVKVEENLSLLSVIGNNILHTSGLGKRIFGALEDINIRMICLGASKHNLCFLVSNNDAEKAIRKLHHEFIEQ
jgi:aspartate kinase